MKTNILIENTEVYGIDASLRGMRNPKDSWNKSDSLLTYFGDPVYNNMTNWNCEGIEVGEKDMILAKNLIKGGSEHRKYLRMIQVWVDLVLPRYIWSEFDTYQFMTKNSCSTMHTLHKRKLTELDFTPDVLPSAIDNLNFIIQEYNEKNITRKEFLKMAKSNLPEGFMQKRTINTNYEQLMNMYHQRKNHGLEEWHDICNWIKGLPYMKAFLNLQLEEERNNEEN